MDEQWSPSVGDRVYVQQEQRAGHVVSIDPDGDTMVYRVELDGIAGTGQRQGASGWGYDPPEELSCTIDELTAD